MANRRDPDPGGSPRGDLSTDVSESDLAEQPADVFERVSEAFFALDDEWRFTYLNSRAEEVLETSAEEMIGQNVWEEFPAATDRQFYEQYHRAMETQEPVSFQEYYPPLDTWFEVSAYPSESGLSVYFQDVTDRRRREQALRDRFDQQHVVAEFGRQALQVDDVDELFAEAVSVLSETLDAPFSCVLEREDAETLLLREGVGWEEGRRIRLASATHAPETLDIDEPLVVSDFESDDRFERSDLLEQRDIRSSVSVVIGTSDDPWGLLAVHDTEPRAFTDYDAAFVQSIATTLMSALERNIHERALLQQGRQLAALNQLNTVAREINHAIARQSSREEIEQLLCDRLVESSSYQLACTAEVDRTSEELTVRAAAGTTEYLDEVRIPADDSETTLGPGGRAAQTGETQVIRGLQSSSEFEPWQDIAEKHDLRSLVVVPVEYDGTLYGIFAVYADREDAFTGEELAVIEDLGEIVGHTVQSLERKRLLMTDEVVRVDLRLQRVDDLYDDLEMDSDDWIDFEQIIPLGEGEFLTYGTSTLSPEELSPIVDAIPHYDNIDVLDTGSETCRFAIHLTDPPALSTIAAHGGRINSLRIEGGDYLAKIELPADVEARSVLDPIREAYPSLVTLAQRRITSDHGLVTAPKALESILTDRQKAVLEAAYFGGYFEWPRDVSAEDLAEQLDVSAPTLHEHLRNAQRKALAEFFEDES